MRENRTSGSMRGCRKRAISRRACALLYQSPPPMAALSFGGALLLLLILTLCRNYDAACGQNASRVDAVVPYDRVVIIVAVGYCSICESCTRCEIT
jgi:hypothetical protein